MMTSRTHTQTAFDGVRIAWRVSAVSESPIVTAQVPVPSIDGVWWDHAHLSRTVKSVEQSREVARLSPDVVAGTLSRWVRSMDGVRMQPRLQ